jgi:hypothetical protein
MKWMIIFIVVLVSAALSQQNESTVYEWPIAMITNTSDYQWSRIDTVRAIYQENAYVVTVDLNWQPTRWYAPYVVKQINK